MANQGNPYDSKFPPAEQTPENSRWPSWLVYLASAVGAVYLLNPGFGLLELIPDQLPLIGNLDEAGATMLIWYGITEFIRRRKNRP